MNPDLKVPFENGQMHSYGYESSEWRDNCEFDASLTLASASRGRSSVKFWFTDAEGKKYEMFVTDFVDMCKQTTMKKGKLKGTFYFVKRGQNYGIKYKGK